MYLIRVLKQKVKEDNENGHVIIILMGFDIFLSFIQMAETSWKIKLIVLSIAGGRPAESEHSLLTSTSTLL